MKQLPKCYANRCVPSDADVMWRTGSYTTLSCPMFDETSRLSIAILKDWRERVRDKKYNAGIEPTTHSSRDFLQ